MALDPFNPKLSSSIQSSGRISVTWNEGRVECLQLPPHTLDVNSAVVVSLTIAHQPTDSPLLKNHLHLILTPSAIDPNLVEQIRVTLPFHTSQQIGDRSILHLLQLLQTEMQAPQQMNQLFVSSIVTVLTTHLLRNLNEQ
jgi:hypothetical protein